MGVLFFCGLIYFLVPMGSLASDPVPIKSVMTQAESYNLQIVTLRGVVRQVRLLEPYCYFSKEILCCGAYTFTLADETGSIEVVVSGVCRGFVVCRPPDVAEAQEVLIEAQIFPPGLYFSPDLPWGGYRRVPLAAAREIRAAQK